MVVHNFLSLIVPFLHKFEKVVLHGFSSQTSTFIALDSIKFPVDFGFIFIKLITKFRPNHNFFTQSSGHKRCLVSSNHFSFDWGMRVNNSQEYLFDLYISFFIVTYL